jgi:transglycosylase-like protein with SLT domain
MKYLFALIALAIATPASAELIFFSESRSMSVKSHRIEGDRVIVSLRSGGEMAFDRSVIVKITPDEVPYPEERSTSAADEEMQTSVGDVLVERTVYDPIIESASNRLGLSARLVKAVIQVESAFQPRARSHKGAMGLMQLMPDIAEAFGVVHPFDPRENIMAGTRLLRELLDRHRGNLRLAIASYNAGPTAVAHYGRVPPFKETQGYVKKVTSLIADARMGADNNDD